MKKTLIVAAAVACAATTLAVALPWGKKKTAQGKVLNIYCWNDEFQSRFNDFYAAKLPKDVKVNWIITPNQGNAYQDKLDEALLAQDKAKADDKIDLFLVESDYALKYVDTDYTLD
ncbi:MAG: carbohydrate ABC transporter substrate-binding protein, partial [Treponema sp.]|nr:carbohydrate ABC transporter substrate-binding protein [Treponema sp.]